jgi:drug/metabolite transporter (DMT)-like permease
MMEITMNNKKSLAQVHIAVLLFGIAGLFGKMVLLPASIIVIGRVFFSSTFLLLYLLGTKKGIRMKERKHIFYFLMMGVTLAIHWSTFFQSIQVSTVAIGLLTFSTFPVFVTFLEPMFFKEKIMSRDICIAIITFLGILFVVPSFHIGNSDTQGILWGTVSGFTYGILSMLNRKMAKVYSGTLIAFYEQVIAFAVLLPFFFWEQPIITIKNILLFILLGIAFTGISHSLFINGLKNLKTQVAGIISSLEPVYGIVFAMIFMNEIPSKREIVGGVIILGTALYSTVKNK